MPKLLLRFTICLILISFLLCQKISAEINLQPVSNIDPFACLNRQQKERIAVCFDENFICHQNLEKISGPETNWTIIILTAAGAVIGGVVLANQMRH